MAIPTFSGKSLLWVAALDLVILYIYAVVSFAFIRESFWSIIMMLQLCSVPLSMYALFPPFAMDSLKTLDLYALYRVLSMVKLCCSFKYINSWCRLYHLFLKMILVFLHCGCFMMCHSSYSSQLLVSILYLVLSWIHSRSFEMRGYVTIHQI